MIKISVITTTYNSGKFLKECVDSILKQTYLDYEHLIIDDGSTDNSLDFLNSNDYPKVKVLRPGKIGRSKALNLGLYNAVGDYIAILDADDVSLQHRLERQIFAFIQNPMIGLCISGANVMNKSGLIFSKVEIPLTDIEIKKRLLDLNPFIHSTLMIKKKLAIQVAGYNERCEKSIDYNFYLELLYHNVVMFGISDPLINLRSYEDSWGKVDKQAIQLRYAIAGIINYFLKINYKKDFMRNDEGNWNQYFSIFSKWFEKRRYPQKWEAKKKLHEIYFNGKKMNAMSILRKIKELIILDPFFFCYRGSGFSYPKDAQRFIKECGSAFFSNNKHDIK